MSEPRPGRPEAAAAIWQWRQVESTSGGRPSARALRIRGTIQSLIAATVATFFWFFWSRTVAGAVFGVAAVLLTSALFSPRGVYATIERAVDALGHSVGTAVTWITMAITYHLFFLPFGLLFRRGQKDAMKRSFEADAATYWIVRGEGRRVSPSRKRQY